jgi:hypothetical protein
MYQKFAYWVNENDSQALQQTLTKEGINFSFTKKAVCPPLSKQWSIGIVPPETWSKAKLCQRQLSWYWTSPHAGQSLIISSFDLAGYGLSQQIILQRTKQRPKEFPSQETQQAMISRQSYLEAKPQEWDDLDLEADELKKWMKIMGLRGLRFKDIFLTHCANHSNFLEPVYYIQDNGSIIPYSISNKTRYVCSACLEFFNIIGESFQRKLVIPCPGAIIFAGLPVNTFLEVKTMGSTI